VFARVHMEDCPEEAGPMEIAVGTHALGLVPAGDASSNAEAARREICMAAAGDVLFLKALTLHRSGASRSQGTRRVLRVDFSPDSLPAPLDWAP
jgi:ectoine hydroxylase-related dioxygenase (phytanoyl-CoA dioxygenase family)